MATRRGGRNRPALLAGMLAALLAMAAGGVGLLATTGWGNPLLERAGLRERPVVRILGAENGVDANAVEAALNAYAEAEGITIEYEVSFEVPNRLDELVAAGRAPDAVLLLQPGELSGLAEQGVLLPLPESVSGGIVSSWGADWLNPAVIDGRRYAAPAGANLKSLVWYQPARFAALGYEVPATWDELVALSRRAAADGETPWCVGFESGPDGGWLFTDWVEKLVLDRYGPDVYDQWVTGEVPFSDPRILGVLDDLGALWSPPGAVAGTRSFVDSRSWQDFSGLLGGGCLMSVNASFAASRINDDPALFDGTSEAALATFPLPGATAGGGRADGGRADGGTVLVGGGWIGAVHDRPEVWSVIRHMTSAGYADDRQRAYAEQSGVTQRPSGALWPVAGQDRSIRSPLEQGMLDQLVGAPTVRYDGSDLMPPEQARVFRLEGMRFAAGEIAASVLASEVDGARPD